MCDRETTEKMDMERISSSESLPNQSQGVGVTYDPAVYLSPEVCDHRVVMLLSCWDVVIML